MAKTNTARTRSSKSNNVRTYNVLYTWHNTYYTVALHKVIINSKCLLRGNTRDLQCCCRFQKCHYSQQQKIMFFLV